MEASHLLDLKKLMGDNPPNLLLPLTKKYQSLFRRFPDNFILLLVFLGILNLIIRMSNGSSIFLLSSVALLILFLFIQKNRIKGIYYVTSDFLLVPYTWLTQKTIKLESVVEILNENFIEKDTGKELEGIRIIIDSPALKFNITGIHEANIVITTANYNKTDLEVFADEIRKYIRESSGVSNTLAQRLEDQVNRSWFGKRRLVIINTLDSSSEFAFYLILIYLISSFITGDRFILGFIIIFILYIFAIILYNVGDLPSSIIGFRSHELGALIYNEADLLTSVRFIAMSRPKKVKLINCELLFHGDPISQINDLREMHPIEIESGVLTYCVAQFIGNHTKSIGAKIKFCYLDEPDEEFELPIYWA